MMHKCICMNTELASSIWRPVGDSTLLDSLRRFSDILWEVTDLCESCTVCEICCDVLSGAVGRRRRCSPWWLRGTVITSPLKLQIVQELRARNKLGISYVLYGNSWGVCACVCGLKVMVSEEIRKCAISRMSEARALHSTAEQHWSRERPDMEKGKERKKDKTLLRYFFSCLVWSSRFVPMMTWLR